MPVPGDILQFSIITEINGTACSNRLFFRVFKQDPTTQLANMVVIMHLRYDGLFAPTTSTDATFSCFKLENLTGNEGAAQIFGVTTGSQLDRSHPQDQVLRYNLYGQEGVNPIRRGAFNQSGISVNLSTDGRLNDNTLFRAVEDSFLSDVTFPDGETTLHPGIRWRSQVGPPPLYSFAPMVAARANPVYLKLRSRKTDLCASA